MKIEQYVYGRVTRGVQSGGGYQPAAISAGIQHDQQLQGQLQKLSYYPSRSTRTARRPRYAYCCLEGRWLSLSRTALAKDLGGNVGYFSHHLVTTTDEVFRLGTLPFGLLREHPFFTQEADLPDDRTLAALDIPVARPEAPDCESPEWTPVLDTVRSLCGTSHFPVPAIVTRDQTDEELLRFVEQVLALFPLRVAVGLSFCSSFAESSENLSFYRFVSVPREAELPDPRESFACIIPGQGGRVSPSPYVDWLESGSVPPADVQNYLILCAGHHAAAENSARKLLVDPRFDNLPAALEQQWPAWASDYLLEHPALFGPYYDRVPSWNAEELVDQFQARPQRVGEALLSLQRHREARPRLVRWILTAATRHSQATVGLLRWADRAGLMEDLAQAGSRLTPEAQADLADALAEAEPASSELHQVLARGAMADDIRSEASQRLVRWVLRPSIARRCPGPARLVSALVDLLEGGRLPGPIEFTSIEPNDYRLFARCLIRTFASGRVPDPEALANVLNRRDPDASLEIVLAAFAIQPSARFLILAEHVLRPDARRRDWIIEALAQAGNRKTVSRYRDWLVQEGVELSTDQRQRLDSLLTSWIVRLFSSLSHRPSRED